MFTEEQRKNYNQLYYKKNKEKILQSKKLYYEDNKEEILESQKIYYINKTKDKIKKERMDNRFYKQRSDCKKLGLKYTLTNDEWNSILLEFNNSCSVCGSYNKLSIMYIIPKNRGGNFEYSNILCACKKCIGGKRDRLFSEWDDFRIRVRNNPEKYRKLLDKISGMDM